MQYSNIADTAKKLLERISKNSGFLDEEMTHFADMVADKMGYFHMKPKFYDAFIDALKFISEYDHGRKDTSHSINLKIIDLAGYILRNENRITDYELIEWLEDADIDPNDWWEDLVISTVDIILQQFYGVKFFRE